MKVEYLLKGLAEFPHLRIYDFDNVEARQLRELFIELAEGESDQVTLQDIDAMEVSDISAVTMRVGAWDRGLKLFDKTGKFEWVLTENSWKDLAQIADAFCDEDCEIEQEWLDQRGDVSVLLEAQR